MEIDSESGVSGMASVDAGKVSGRIGFRSERDCLSDKLSSTRRTHVSETRQVTADHELTSKRSTNSRDIA